MTVCIITVYGVKYDTRVRYMAETIGKVHNTWVIGVDKGEGECALQSATVALVPRRGTWLPRNVFGWSLKYAQMVGHMVKLLWRIKPDVIQAEDADSLPLAWFAARLLGCKLVYDAKELHIDSGSDIPHRLYRIAEGLFIKRADLVLAANQVRADYMKRYYALRNRPVVVRNMPLQSAPVRPTTRLLDFLSEHEIEADKVVLYQGGIIAGRGLDLLVKAMTLVPDNVVLVFLGGASPFREAIQGQVRALGMQRRVLFMERIPPEELLNVVAAADLGVVIYQNINLNNYMCASTKQYEYVSAGVPVIMPTFPHLMEFLTQYDAGVSFEPSDVNSIAEAIRMALDKYPKSPELIERLRLIRQLEDWESDGSQLLNAYEDLQ